MRAGRRGATTRAPASSSSPTFRTSRSLIVSPSGSTNISYATPPGTTTFPSFTVSSSTAFVPHASKAYPFGRSTFGQPCFGTSSPPQ